MKLLGITVGDVAGVGPEIILKSFLKEKEYLNNSVVYGSFDVFAYYNEKFNYGLKLNKINDVEEIKNSVVNIIDPFPIKMDEFEIGKLSSKCGDGSYQYLAKAVEDAMKGKIVAVVTAPLNKEALHMGGHNFAGHTEILAELSNTKDYSMLLWSNSLKTIHVSTHRSLRSACDAVKKERVMTVVELANDTLKLAGYQKPRIAVAGLNPHSGENGLFGDEEIKEIIPAIEECKKQGVEVFGPIPPDTVFLKCLKGEYDIVVAMYHDQGHIPLKLLAFNDGVNMTVGLPFIRTSVDHGTAFDIAGKNIADEGSMLEALRIAQVFTK